MQTLNERITLVRDSKAMKQKDFAELLNVPRSSLSEIESGKRSASIDVIIGISTHFKDINLDWLLTGEGEVYREKIEPHEEKVLELYSALSDNQRREILSAIEEKQQFNQLIETVHYLQRKVG